MKASPNVQNVLLKTRRAVRTKAAANEVDTLPATKKVVFPTLKPGGLLPDQSSYSEQLRVRADEVGPDQRTNIISVGNLLQEVAGNHAVALWGRTEEGFATEPLMVKLNLIFVMTRMLITMDDYPRWGDNLEIETWFQKEGRIAARRDWTIACPASGRRLGGATSMWVMINTKTRRIAKIPTELLERLEPFTPQPPRFAIGRSASEKMPEIDEARPVVQGPKQVVRRGDIDMNGHVNNVTYIAWALETVPDDVYRDRRLAEIEIDFKAECNYGDVVESVAQEVPGWTVPAAPHHSNGNGHGAPLQDAVTFVHVLQACTTSEGEATSCKEFARVRTTWVPRA